MNQPLSRVKSFPLIALMMLVSPFAYSQPAGKNKHERIEKAKIAFLTERLSLTAEQSSKFWPVYNEYSAKRRQQMMEIKRLSKENKNPSTSDETIRKNLSLILEKKQAILDFEKDYMNKFLAVIKPRQLDALHKAERDFMKMLRKKMEEKGKAINDGQ